MPFHAPNTIEKVRECLAQEGYTLLSTVYINNRRPLLIQCPKGHKFERKYSYWTSKKRCPICAKPNRHKTIDQIAAELAQEGYTLRVVEWVPYNLKRSHLVATCAMGHSYKLDVWRWSIGQRCRLCRCEQSGANLKKTIDQIAAELAKARYTLLSTKYEGNRSPIQVRCPNGHIYDTCWNNFQRHGRCPQCGSSDEECQIADFVSANFKGKIELHNRQLIAPKEIDIFLPDLKLAIEYCGVYYHGQTCGNKLTSYHRNKMLACRTLGIRLITIFEDEWLDHQEIVKSRLLCLLGAPTLKRLYARQCEIRAIDTRVATVFLQQHHIQGASHTRVAYGAFFEDVLVSVMTFTKPSIAKGACRAYDWELDKFASKINHLVVGVASRLFKRFLREYQPANVVTYADLRWSVGSLYEKLGFKLLRTTYPNYWYFKVSGGHKRWHRFGFRKSLIAKRFSDVFDPALTEYENMLKSGYDRIWDCGNAVYLCGEIIDRKKTFEFVAE